jgi:hypothetical protein
MTHLDTTTKVREGMVGMVGMFAVAPPREKSRAHFARELGMS